jgi:hypothetical protein
MMIRSLILAALVAGSVVTGFAPPSSTIASKTSTTTRLFGNTKTPPEMPPIKDISYGEQSRQYRRTVYTHDDWRKHRSPDRFFYYIRSIVSSGVYKNLAREVSTTTGIATFIVLYNAMVGGYQDWDGVKHAALISSVWTPMLTLPLAPFTLSSPSLGLLLGTFGWGPWSFVLSPYGESVFVPNSTRFSSSFTSSPSFWYAKPVFRTNTSYQRWDEARKVCLMNTPPHDDDTISTHLVITHRMMNNRIGE